jgi:hypothetical protein
VKTKTDSNVRYWRKKDFTTKGAGVRLSG